MKPFYLLILSLFLSLNILAQISSGLVANYSFNSGEAKDDLSNSYAKISGAALTEDRFGNPHCAYYLQGNFDSYINLGTHNQLKPKIGSISLWVKINQIIYKGMGVETNPILITRSHNGEDFNEAYYIGYDMNTKNLNTNNSLSELKQSSIFPPHMNPIQQWHHVVITFNNSFLCLYLNGDLVEKARKTFETTYLETDSVVLGNRISAKNTRFLNGCVDDIAFYDRVLSHEEVLALYAAPNPKKMAAITIVLILLLVVSLVVVSSIFFKRILKKRVEAAVKAEKEQSRLLNLFYEQEIKVLKAQMDPHFIFNALNSIQQFIVTNDNEKAQFYLTKFSRLIRKLLESNTKNSLSLKDEIELLDDYLEIESLRFNKAFEYHLECKNLDPAAIFIPNFLIQPFVENAIWHGLLPKEGHKKLHITFELLTSKTLSCTVDDDGVGRSNSEKSKMPKNKQSLAISFTKQRLELMGKIENCNYSLNILDKLDPNGLTKGTLVNITMPVMQM